jgi:DNA-binding NarL/FixJ family response regulator
MTRNTAHEIATHRILIVDDHPIVRRGLAQIINDQPDLEVCGQAESQAEALKLLVETEPELIIVDVSLKDGSGIELIKQIKSRLPDAKMLVSSMHDESLFAERALRAGAMGYIDKQEATERTVEAIRHVLGGRVYLSSRMADRMLHRIVAGEAEPDRSPIESLSDRELEVFELIGQGLMTRQIAKKLHLSHKTIETYRENIKQKLNLKSGAELTRHALQWVLEIK